MQEAVALEKVNDTPANAVEVVTQKFMNLIESALGNPANIVVLRQELNSILDSHSLSLREGLSFLDKISEYIYNHRLYSVMKKMDQEKRLTGRSFHDFTIPDEQQASLLGVIIDVFPPHIIAELKK